MTRLASIPLALALLPHGSAQALVNQASPSVVIRGCPRDLNREIGYLLSIELRSLARGTQVSVTCADRDVKVVARDREGACRVGRSLMMEPVALSARARAVALAAAELVAALEGRPSRQAPAPQSLDREALTVRRSVRPPTPPPRRWELTASTTLGGLQRSLVYGGGVTVDHRPHRCLGWRAGLSAQRTSRELGPGTGSALLGSAAAALTLGWRTGWGRFTVGAGGRVGVVHLSAETDAPAVTAGTVTGAWAGPLGLLDVRIPAGSLWLALGVELTYVTLPVKGRVEGEGVYGVDGLLVVGTAGVGLSF